MEGETSASQLHLYLSCMFHAYPYIKLVHFSFHLLSFSLYFVLVRLCLCKVFFLSLLSLCFVFHPGLNAKFQLILYGFYFFDS